MLIGLTGGIACGKSTVCSILAKKRVQIIDADAIAKQVLLPGRPAYMLLVKVFGSSGSGNEKEQGILLADGSINRKKLGSLIFGNAAKRAILNGIVHPFVIYEMLLAYLRAVWKEPFSVVVWDVPLLFETILHRFVNFSCTVIADRESQLQRLHERGFSDEEAAQRIASQLSNEAKCSRSDFCIENNNDTPHATLECKVSSMLREAKRKQSIWWEALHFLAAACFFLCYSFYLRLLLLVRRIKF